MRWKILPILAVLLAASACKTEQRNIKQEQIYQPLAVSARENFVPGGPVTTIVVKNPAEGKAYDIGEGARLYAWYNCSGCHSNGGGGMGPPLMSRTFIYGSEPDNIFDTIVKGRPNGMPSWGGRIPEHQIWQIVAYVRSLSGQEPPTATPARSDDMEKKTTAELK